MNELSRARKEALKPHRTALLQAWSKSKIDHHVGTLERIFGAPPLLWMSDEESTVLHWSVPFEVSDMIFTIDLTSTEGTRPGRYALALKDDWIYKAEFPDWLEEATHESWQATLDRMAATLKSVVKNETFEHPFDGVWSEPAMLNALGWKHESEENYNPSVSNLEAIAWLEHAVKLPDLNQRWPTLGPWLRLMHDLNPIPFAEAERWSWLCQAASAYHHKNQSPEQMALPEMATNNP